MHPKKQTNMSHILQQGWRNAPRECTKEISLNTQNFKALEEGIKQTIEGKSLGNLKGTKKLIFEVA
jgi:hypothetical protein